MKYKVNVIKEFNKDIIISADDEEQAKELIEYMLKRDEIDFDEKNYNFSLKIL